MGDRRYRSLLGSFVLVIGMGRTSLRSRVYRVGAVRMPCNQDALESEGRELCGLCSAPFVRSVFR